MTLGEKLKFIRKQAGLSQEAIGAQGFVSTPGWIKIENGQRSPSEQLIERFAAWLIQDKHIAGSAAKALKAELFTLKYLGNHSPFVRAMARDHAKSLPTGDALLAHSPSVARPKRGRTKLAAA